MSLLVVNAFAWGKDGHQVVANLAAAQLTAKALAEVERLLALEPGETLESISTWADEDRSPLTGPWHYVNFPKSICTYDAERDCPDGNCVVGVIGKQLEILASNASDELRLKALKYFVHLEADVHQPLHAGHGDDRGGNSYQLHAFGHGTNLHAIWDWELIGNINEDPQALTRRLISKGNAATGADLSVAHAAEESCKIVGTPGFYPGRNLRPDYVQRFTPVLEQRLSEAGARLAGLLNRVFR
ncbi:MAG: S1/P1 nuclease [Rhodoferax sp.]